jgi:hypothetical protein
MRLPVRLLCLAALLAGIAGAQVAAPSPLTREGAAAVFTPGGWIVAEGRALSALQSGFPATAAVIYGGLLADPAVPAEARARLQQARLSALLDAGDVAEAERALAAYDGPKDSPYRLRAGLLAAHQRRGAAARAELAEVDAADLPATDRGWWHFLQALVADLDGDVARANAQFDAAVQASVSERQRARFLLGQAQAQLRTQAPDEARLAAMRANVEQFQGTRAGSVWVRTYATALHMLQRGAEARAVLQRQLAVLPPTERETADQFRLLLGLIAGEDSAEGRRAFRELLRDGQRPETQRTALYALNRGTRTPDERERLRRELGELISGPRLHPIIEDLLLVRAQAALEDRQFNGAEEDARRLLDQFPGSPLKPAALGVRLAVAWEARLYRTAAEIISQLRAVVPPGRERSELGVLLAEAFFRSGDFANAADAYDAALREAPQVVPAGRLIFQRVLSDVRADRLDAAARLLDEMAGNPAFDAENRWQAEWNLVREMQARGRVADARARVERLAAAEAPAVADELRVRLLWLRAKLAFDDGDAAAAVARAAELLAGLGSARLDAALASEVAATTLLLQAQASLELGRDDEGAALLERLRTEHRATKVAVYSFIVESSRQARRGALAAAQKTLVDLVDAHPRSEYAPFALYEAAVYAERQGLDANLRYAYERLEQLVTRYPNDDLVFYARLKQGDLLRRLNDFGAARLVYEDLINNRATHPDVLLAQAALGATLFSQGANNPGNYEAAAAVYERIRELPSAPLDLRVEAGYMWGYAQQRRGQTASALAIYWGLADGFLLDASAGARLGPTGRYWMARALLELGQALEDAGRLDEAQRAYQLILDHDLGAAAQARAKLARFRVGTEARP